VACLRGAARADHAQPGHGHLLRRAGAGPSGLGCRRRGGGRGVRGGRGRGRGELATAACRQRVRARPAAEQRPRGHRRGGGGSRVGLSGVAPGGRGDAAHPGAQPSLAATGVP
jgi:hypothetical protein